MDASENMPENTPAVENQPEAFHAPDAVGTPAAVPAKPDLEQLVEDWFRRHFHELGAWLDEARYNHLHAAKEELKARLRALA